VALTGISAFCILPSAFALGGFGWLCAAPFLVSAFRFPHFSFCQSVALGGFGPESRLDTIPF
jgi:hypothetical protein